MSTVIVTGAGGFVGRRLIRRLHAAGDTIIGVGRGEQPADWPQTARWVRADLANASAYESALSGADCVVHLAALTGKAKPEAFQRGNVDTTRTLLEAATRAGVQRFIFVSSIAAAFTDRRFYPYAESKIAAEELVRNGRIAPVIVRPTMILGPGSPIEESLAKLAGLPVSPMFGDGAHKVQPIDVEDVVEVLANLVRETDIQNTLIEIGGADTYDLRELYARLRAVRGIQGAPRFVHLPVYLIRRMLALVEGPLLAVLPLTAGQLATFVNESVAAPHAAMKRLLPTPHTSPRAAPKVEATHAPPPTPPDPTALDAEFTRFARHVADVEPTPYQRGKYLDFHQRRYLKPANAFDALLLRLSSKGGIGLALADAYSGLLYRTALVRAKLVLALAILESSGPSFKKIDAPTGGVAIIDMGLRGAMTALSLIVAAPFLLPAQILLRSRPAR